MEMRARWCIVLLLAAAGGVSAQVPVPDPPPSVPGLPSTAAVPTSALQYLERELRDHPPPLEPPHPSLAGPILGGLASAGCAVWALTPTFARWGPEGEQGEYFGTGMLGGALQGFLLNAGFGMSLAEALYRAPDLRAEYGNLLDLSPGERERRAYQILRRRAETARRQRVAGFLLTVGATALPAGVYYLGSALAGPNPNVEGFGVGYVVGIALGSLPFAVLMLMADSPEERFLERLEAGRLAGGQP